MTIVTSIQKTLSAYFLFNCTLLLFGFISFSTPCYSQSGSWHPSNSSLSYPRILLSKSQIPKVKEIVQQGRFAELTSGIYQSSLTVIPVDNSENSNRRERARIAKNSAFVLLMNYK